MNSIKEIVCYVLYLQTWKDINPTRTYHNSLHVSRGLRAVNEIERYFNSENDANVSNIYDELNHNTGFIDVLNGLCWAVAGHDIYFELDANGNPNSDNEQKSFERLMNTAMFIDLGMPQKIVTYIESMILHTKVEFPQPFLVASSAFSQDPAIAFGQLLIEICDKANSFLYERPTEDELEHSLNLNILLQFEGLLRKQYAHFDGKISHDFAYDYCNLVAQDDTPSSVIFRKAVTGFINYTNLSIIESLQLRFDESVLAQSNTIVHFVNRIINAHRKGIAELAKYCDTLSLEDQKIIVSRSLLELGY
jgi:hypothetical protein